MGCCKELNQIKQHTRKGKKKGRNTEDKKKISRRGFIVKIFDIFVSRGYLLFYFIS